MLAWRTVSRHFNENRALSSKYTLLKYEHGIKRCGEPLLKIASSHFQQISTA